MVKTNEKLSQLNSSSLAEIDSLNKKNEGLQGKLQQLSKLYQELENEVLQYKKKAQD